MKAIGAVVILAATLALGACSTEPDHTAAPRTTTATSTTPFTPRIPLDVTPTACLPDERGEAAPSFYQEQYDASIVTTLTEDLDDYRLAVASGDAEDIGYKAGTLYSMVKTNETLMADGTYYGCHDPNVFTALIGASERYAAVLDSINGGTATPADAVAPHDDFVLAMNAYAGQFGGARIPEH